MSVLDLARHLLSFAAPAFAVALLVASGARLVLRRVPQRPSWPVSIALDFVAGLAVLVLGLWFFGHDGKMATYALLVLAVATCEWVGARGWRS
jgi:hypothetical protein